MKRKKKSAPTAAVVPASLPAELLSQLRGMQFGLIMLSIAIFIGVVNSQFHKLNTALTQALQIREVMSRWPALRQQIYLDSIIPVAGDFASLSAIGVMQMNNPPPIELWFQGYAELQPEQLWAYAAWQFDADLSLSNRSLASFEDLWDALRRGVVVSGPNIKFPSNIQERNCKVRVRRSFSGVEADSYIHSMCFKARSEPPDDDYPPASTRLSKPHAPSGVDKNQVIDLILELGPTRYEPRRDVQITIPFELVQAPIDPSALQKMYPAWRSGTYAAAFHELAEVSDGFQDFDIDEAIQRVKALHSASDQAVDLFGLKLPREGAIFGAMVILACVQAYFLILLHDLLRRIQKSNQKPDHAAWFGLHPSASMLAATLISAAALPLSAAAALAWTLEKVSPAALAAAFISACLSLFVGLALWRLHRFIRTLN